MKGETCTEWGKLLYKSGNSGAKTKEDAIYLIATREVSEKVLLDEKSRLHVANVPYLRPT